MGGNIFKDPPTVRLQKTEYEILTNKVLSLLSARFPDNKFHLLSGVRNKVDFGDADVLIKNFPTITDEVTLFFIDTLNLTPLDISRNSNVTSIRFENFQFDFIFTNLENWETSIAYLNFSDSGNLVGRISKKLGFKYGHDGLTYMFREQDKTFNVFAETVVSKDILAIHKFLDLDHNKFLQGVDNIEDVFVWVANSKYFHRDIYLLQNRNHVSRTRDKKRKTYNQFLQWCAVTTGLNAYPWTEMREQDGYAGKPEFLKLALETFPEFAKQHREIVRRHEQERQVKARFNGNIVRELIGLEGKALGEFMQDIINKTGGKDAIHWVVLNATDAEIADFIVSHFEKFNSH